jgi:hypothetical protein
MPAEPFQLNHVSGANHASLLGRDHAHHIVEAIRRMVPAAD